MATQLPPNNNELLDQAAVGWMRTQGFLKEDSCAGLEHLGNNQIWATHDFTTHVQGPDQIPKTGGGYYDPMECPTYIDVKNWATALASVPLPCNTVPQNVSLTGPPAPPAPQNFNTVNWFNPNNSHTAWLVDIQRRVTGVGTFETIATVNVNGVSTNQAFADTTEVQGTSYSYQLRYRLGGQSTGAFTSVYTRVAGP